MSPLVSVIIITYKRPVDILRRALESVLHQTYNNLEIIIVNDAPEALVIKTEIKQMLKEYDDFRIIYYEHEKNMGANAARNSGLQLAHGEFIAFLDDDDEWSLEKIQYQLDVMLDEKIGIVYGPFITSNNNDREVFRPERPGNNPLCKILEGNFIGGTSFPLLRTSFVKKVGGFDISLVSCQEYELWIRMLNRCKVAYCNHILGVYYHSNDSTFKSNKKYIMGINSVVEKHKLLFCKYPMSYSNRLISMSFEMFKGKDIYNAIRYKIRAISVCAYNPNNLLLLYTIKRIKNKRKRKERTEE